MELIAPAYESRGPSIWLQNRVSDCDGKAARSLRAANLNLGIGWDRLGFSLWQESNFDEIKDCWRTHIELSLIGFTATADGLESMKYECPGAEITSFSLLSSPDGRLCSDG